MIAWMRRLEIIFTSTTLKRRVVFGNNDNINLDINVEGYKYMSTLKDNFTVKITNLSYKEIVELIAGKYDEIEIKCGYKSCGIHSIYKGGVLYISNELGDIKSNTVIILCASKLISKYGQARMNFTINSGINIYSAIKFICRRAGIPNSNISNEFKHKFVNEMLVINKTPANILESIATNYGFSTNTDETNGGIVSIWNATTTDKRVIKIDKNNLIFTGGYPRINSEGLRITVMPTFNFMSGDVISIDNALIDVSAGTKDEVFKNNTIYLDTDGQYIVFEVSYTLQNRGQAFQCELLCKAKSLIKKVSGGTN